MYLGIEIGGTKLQLGCGDGQSGVLKALVRRDIDRTKGARGILDQIAEAARPLIAELQPTQIGYGFGGPVDSTSGRVRISHQVDGWENFPLVQWTREQFDLPAKLGNDCDVAALAEFRYGAGRGAKTIFYVTVGTGVGGGCVVEGKLLGEGRPAIAEIGHLRPGLDCDDPHQTVESIAAGPGIAAYARAKLQSDNEAASGVSAESIRELKSRLGDDISAATLGKTAREGNEYAKQLLNRPVQTLGWAISQVVTLIAPEIVVVGGGVSLLGEELFFAPLRKYAAKYGFPPLAGSYQIVPAALGEEAVVHGAVALAASDS